MKHSFNPTTTSLANEHINRSVNFETEIEQNMADWHHQINQMGIDANNSNTNINSSSNPYQRLEYDQGMDIFQDNGLNYFRNDLPFDTSLLFSPNTTIQPQHQSQSEFNSNSIFQAQSTQPKTNTYFETASSYQDKVEENSSSSKSKYKSKEKLRKNSRKDRTAINLRELKPLLPSVGDSTTDPTTELNIKLSEPIKNGTNITKNEASGLAEELATKSNYQMLKEGNYSLLGMKFNDEVKTQVEKRKLNHKMAEKVRRQVQNHNFYQLKSTIPCLQEKDSKVKVLDITKKVLTLQNEVIKRRSEKLTELIHGLETELMDVSEDLDLSCYHKLTNLIEKLAKN